MVVFMEAHVLTDAFYQYHLLVHHLDENNHLQYQTLTTFSMINIPVKKIT